MIRRTAEEWGGYFHNSSLALPPTSQAFRYWPSDYYSDYLSAWLDAGLEPGTFNFLVQVANRWATRP